LPPPPPPNRVTAVANTATSNQLCLALTPFYYEIGDKTGALTSGGALAATAKMSIASASKWVYGSYVEQLRTLTAQDIPFLNFTSGYTGVASGECNGTASVNACLKLPGYSTLTAANVGKFDYNGGHMENHASQLTKLGAVASAQLGTTLQPLIGVNFLYTQPLMSGGIYTDAADYATFLRSILNGTLKMHDALGTNAVCTHKSASCTAVYSPIPLAWHYSMGHWVEDDSTGDGAFSSPGAFGFYPWIDATKTYYGIIARQAPSASVSGEQQGYLSSQCGHVLRKAWTTGVAQ
jgi:hypothetical protein